MCKYCEGSESLSNNNNLFYVDVAETNLFVKHLDSDEYLHIEIKFCPMCGENLE